MFVLIGYVHMRCRCLAEANTKTTLVESILDILQHLEYSDGYWPDRIDDRALLTDSYVDREENNHRRRLWVSRSV